MQLLEKWEFNMRYSNLHNHSCFSDGIHTVEQIVAEAEKMKGKKVLIVDDVISTGESLWAIEKLVNKAGGEIVGRMAVLAEGSAADREDIIFLEKLPLFNKDGQAI